MFANAYKSAAIYTHPVVISQKFFDGSVTAGCATFIILNPDGWALTAAHAIMPLMMAEQHQKEMAQYETIKKQIESDSNLNRKLRKQKLRKLIPNEKWIMRQSFWWGTDGVSVDKIRFNNLLDLAVFKLSPFNGEEISEYPVFKNPNSELPIGTSLCKLGFPFHNVKSIFDETTNNFTFAPGALPMPRFPLDGIFTRVAIFIDKETGKNAKFIETSTPGLRGQSGGPTFDKDGNIWALQSRTSHLPLGFSPKIRKEGREIEENQFINVGLGSHVQEIITFLSEENIQFNVSTE
jgi:hypothetical protein